MTPVAAADLQTARTVPTPGVEQTIRFLAGSAGELFCSVHAPIGGADASLVMCPPLLADHPFSYRRELLMAVELARHGVAVWRFHYAGTGYSDGSPHDVSFDSMVADARLVVDAAAAAAPAPVTIGGTRCGAMIAAAVGRSHPLAFWEAVTDGTAYLREGFRARMIADGGQLQRTPPTSAELLEELRRGAPSTMHPRMRGSFREVLRNATPLLLAYGTHDEGFPSFKAALDGDLGPFCGRRATS